MPTQDIRPGLRERLDEADRKLAELQAELARVADDKEAIRHLLAREDQRYRVTEPPAPAVKPPSVALGDYILAALRDKPQTKEDLRLRADQSGYEGAGRAVHATLMNMVQSGRLRQNSDGTYELAKPESLVVGNAPGVTIRETIGRH